ncbi:hypothetical protein VTI74DRAFT_3863 [Chaetomium olivicolor]
MRKHRGFVLLTRVANSPTTTSYELLSTEVELCFALTFYSQPTPDGTEGSVLLCLRPFVLAFVFTFAVHHFHVRETSGLCYPGSRYQTKTVWTEQ